MLAKARSAFDLAVADFSKFYSETSAKTAMKTPRMIQSPSKFQKIYAGSMLLTLPFVIATQPLHGQLKGNTATGTGALNNNTGNHNSAFGFNSLLSNKAGSFNTGIGSQVLKANTTGASNVAVGFQALYRNSTGSLNTAVGDGALLNLTGGSSNVAIGEDSGFNLTTESNNVLIANNGVVGESNTMRIGDPSVHKNTYIAGVISGDGSGLFNVGSLPAKGYKEFRTPGTYSFQLPADVKNFMVEVVGAGGGGGFDQSNNDRDDYFAGGGGGYSRKIFSATANRTCKIVIGKGGDTVLISQTQSAVRYKGTKGGSSSFVYSGVTITSSGGGGGGGSNEVGLGGSGSELADISRMGSNSKWEPTTQNPEYWGYVAYTPGKPQGLSIPADDSIGTGGIGGQTNVPAAGGHGYVLITW